MNSARAKHAPLLLIFLIFFNVTVSCGAGSAGEFGRDGEYFAGLRKLEDGRKNEARTHFIKCAKEGTYYCARRSAEKLTEFGTLEQKLHAADSLVQNYRDGDALLKAAEVYFPAGEFGRLITATSEISTADSPNRLVLLRFKSILKQGGTVPENSIAEWVLGRPLSSEHYEFFRDFSVTEAGGVGHELERIISFRLESYRRNYTFTAEFAGDIIPLLREHSEFAVPQIASDLGKAFLYGSSEFSENAQMMLSLADEFSGQPTEFYFRFYAGRLFSKTSVHYIQAEQCFYGAAETAPDAKTKDNALWYLLDNRLEYAPGKTVAEIESVAKTWTDPEYFDDFFDSLLSYLIENGKWSDILKVLRATEGYASDRTSAQFAYIYARLLQTGTVTIQESQSLQEELFRRACRSGSEPYYRILAAYHLNLAGAELGNVLSACSGAFPGENDEYDAAAEKLLSGYSHFGFPELIFEEWQNLYRKGIPQETAASLSAFLNKISSGNDDYMTRSLRIISRTPFFYSGNMTDREMKLLYPKNYQEFVDTYSRKYDITDSVIFSLIRSESFFDPDAVSHAGATGLTQLMELTGGDIARRLRIENYSLTDPETNIRFGTFYLADLIKRCDGSVMLAFFSYNAGITRVRRWLQSSTSGFGRKKNMPADIFLETVPYSETRGYGRKLVSAAAMYGWLYNENSDSGFRDTIEKIL